MLAYEWVITLGCLAVCALYYASPSILRRAAPLSGRVAIVTGGERGLGLQIARQLAGEGVKVVIWGIDRIAMKEVKESFPMFDVVYCDVGSEQAIKQSMDTVRRRFGDPTIIVCLVSNKSSHSCRSIMQDVPLGKRCSSSQHRI